MSTWKFRSYYQSFITILFGLIHWVHLWYIIFILYHQIHFSFVIQINDFYQCFYFTACKALKPISYNKTVDGVTKTLYDIKMELVIIFDLEEIKFVYQEKAYPFWSFGAEVGGYVGMFLGYSVIQVPDLVNTAFGTAVNLYGMVSKRLF